MEWISIIWGIASPFLMKCLQQQQPTVKDPRELLKSKYNAETESFPEELVNDTIPSMYRAIRKARHQTPPHQRKDFPKYTPQEVYQMASDKLKESMNASDAQVRSCKAIADSLPNED